MEEDGGGSGAIPRSQVRVKTVLTVCLTVLGVAAGLLILVQARFTVGLTIASALIAVALHHGADLLVRKGVGRRLAVTAVLILALAVVAGLGLIFVPPAVEQARELATRVPQWLAELRASDLYQRLNQRLQLEERLEQPIAPGGEPLPGVNPLVRAVGGVVTVLVGTVVVLVNTIFMLYFGGGLVRRLLNESTPERRARYERVLRNIYQSVGGYLTGLGLIAVINAVLTSIFLAILGVPYFLALGILSGVASFIPFAGATFAGIAISLIALGTGGLTAGLITAAYYLLYQQFENNVLVPFIYRRTVDVNPLVVLIVLLVMTELAGILGALLAVPAVAAAQILLRELLAMRRGALNLPPQGPASPPPATRELEQPPPLAPH